MKEVIIILSNELYIKQSLDINLFFLRIMKEHSLFLAVGFQPNSENLIKEAKYFNTYFNNLLSRAFSLIQGVTSIRNDAITKYTLDAEKKTSAVTGMEIDIELTKEELSLLTQSPARTSQGLVHNIYDLNNDAITATKALIDYKTKVLDAVLSCKIYTANYPLLIDHIRREAYLFVDLLQKLQNRSQFDGLNEEVKQQVFWNNIMSEHSKFIRGLLDPSEENLIKLAEGFGTEFENLNEKAMQVDENLQLFTQVTQESITLANNLQGFQHQGTEGILNCQIKSLIVPLLGDHVIRETNHYLLLLKK